MVLEVSIDMSINDNHVVWRLGEAGQAHILLLRLTDGRKRVDAEDDQGNVLHVDGRHVDQVAASDIIEDPAAIEATRAATC